MYTALYRSFRPETFSQIIGQTHIVRILTNQIKANQVGHAYLFCGTRGTGKTSTARILAKAVNCLSDHGEIPCGTCENCINIQKGIFLDVIEIDAASNNGVDNVRELKDSLQYPPAVGRKKVYIIDEVHMLSINASNALLKSLEEPPDNVLFILATTESHKLPATILSRCIRLDFKRIPEKLLIENMKMICGEKGVDADLGALSLIASNADGSARDSLSLLDQCLAAGDSSLTRDSVLELLGTVGEEVLIRLSGFLNHGQTAEALLLLDEMIADGKDVRQLMKDLLAHFRNLLIAKYVDNPMDLINMSNENVQRIQAQNKEMSLDFISGSILELARMQAEARWSTQPRVLLEMCLIQLSTGTGLPAITVRETASIAKVDKPVVAPVPVSEKSPQPPQPHQPSQPPQPSEMQDREKDQSQVKAQHPGQMESLWDQILADGEKRKGSFSMLRRGAKISELGEEFFCIACENEIALRQAESEKQLIEELMEIHCGKPLRVKYHKEEKGKASQPAQSMEDLAEHVSGQLGIEVSIE